MNTLSQFEEIWVVDFEFRCANGEVPMVHCMVAREAISGQLLRFSGDELSKLPQAPFDTGPRALFVAFYASAEFGCFLELGWDLPIHTLDLYAEFRLLNCGTEVTKKFGLIAALDHFNLSEHTPSDKQGWREMAMRAGPYSGEEMNGLLDYCQEDVDATYHLFWKMEHSIYLPQALMRGRYMQSIARMERNGIPLDATLLSELTDKWETIKRHLIDEVDTHGIYIDGSFSERRFEKMLVEREISWGRLKSGRLRLTDEEFRQQAKVHPEVIAPYHELRTSLSRLKLSDLAVGHDGRNRTLLSPYRSDTSRNQPSTSKFIFGPAAWVRGLIKPQPGMFIAYIDWAQQELGIAAALSGDARMMEAYRSGDPYLRFAQMAGAVPETATKNTYPKERAIYKVCMLAVQYGMGAESLAAQIDRTLSEANELLRAHKDAFPKYWLWYERILTQGFGNGKLEATFGWSRTVLGEAKSASVGNFPVQANGAEMLRLAIINMHKANIQVAAPIHDAVLVEGPIEHVNAIVDSTQRCMRHASKIILNGFELDSDVKVFTYPNRYIDEDREVGFWNIVMEQIGRDDCLYYPPSIVNSKEITKIL